MDIDIQCDNVSDTSRLDFVLLSKTAKSYVIMNVAIPGHCRIHEKAIEKIKKYPNLKRKLKRIWSSKKLEVVPVVLGAQRCDSKSFSGWMEKLGIKLNVGMVQKSGNSLDTPKSLRHVS